MPWKVPITVDGLTYPVEFGGDSEPSETDINAAVQQILAQSEQSPKDEPLFDLSDTLSATWQAVKGLPTTAPHAFRQLYEGLDNPWKRGEGYLKSQETVDAYQQELEAANLEAEKSGDISIFSRGMRQAGQSLGFSVGAMGAGLVTSTPSAAAGRAIGSLAGPKGAVAGEIIGRGAGALAAGYGAAYRMAGAQFLDDARKEIDAKFLSTVGRPPNEQEQEEAYQELLPLAQAFGNAEAGPEAIGNLAMAGAGKYVFGLGRKTIEKLAASALGKTGAAAGALATELGGETVTGVEQNRIEAQKQAMYRGEQPEEAPRTMDEYVTSLKEVAPATLATMGLMSVPPATVKAVQAVRGKPAEEQPAPDTDFARRAAMEGATEFRDTTAGVPVVVEGITIATIPPGSDLSPDDVAAFVGMPDGPAILKRYADQGRIVLPEIVKPVENVDRALTDEMNQNVAAGAANAPATVEELKKAQALYEAQTLARERQAAEETLRVSIDEALRSGRPFTPEEQAFMRGQPLSAQTPTPAPATSPGTAFDSRNTEMLPDEDNFGGKFDQLLRIKPDSYVNKDGIETVEYTNPDTGVVDAYISAFGNNDFIAYMRVYDENGNPTNRFTSKLERRTNRPGATRAMIEELQSRLPSGHQYAEDVSVSTDGLRFITNQLNQGYSVATNSDGTPITTEVAISGESITNDLPIAVDPNGKFENIRVRTPAEFAKVKEFLGKKLEAFGVGLNASNVRWENGTAYIDLPVLQRQAQRLAEEAPSTEQSVKLELTPDESGATGAEMKEEIQQTPAETEQEKAKREYQEYVDRAYRPTWGTTSKGETAETPREQPQRLTDEEMEKIRSAAAKGRSQEAVDEINRAKAQAQAVDEINRAKAQAQAVEELKREGKITPDDERYWSTPIKGQPKDPIPDAKDTNGVQVREGDVIEFGGVLGGTGRSTVSWVEPRIANASGEVQPGAWVGNGLLVEGSGGFTIIERDGKPFRKEPTPAPQPITPTGEAPTDSLPADQPTSGDVGTSPAVQRDPSKPEQMTPKESYEAYTTAKELAPNLADMPKTRKQIQEGVSIAESSGIKDPELQRTLIDSAKSETGLFAGPYIKVQRVRLIEEALEDKKPVSAEAVDTYGIKLPEGYARQGELYVFQPTVTTATETQKLDFFSTTLQEARGEAVEALREAMNSGRGRFKGRNITLLVTPSSRDDVMLQVTRVSNEGEPQGHQDIIDEQDFNDELKDQDNLDVVLEHVRPDIGQARTLGAFGIPKFRKPVSFNYRLRLREVGPGTAPKGFISSEGRDVSYDRPLTRQEMSDFEMSPVGATPLTATTDTPEITSLRKQSTTRGGVVEPEYQAILKPNGMVAWQHRKSDELGGGIYDRDYPNLVDAMNDIADKFGRRFANNVEKQLKDFGKSTNRNQSGKESLDARTRSAGGSQGVQSEPAEGSIPAVTEDTVSISDIPSTAETRGAGEKKSRALPTFTPPPKEPFKPSAERFAQFYVDDGFSKDVALKNGTKLMQAIESGEWTNLLHPDNKKSRAIWETWTRTKLPKGVAATEAAFRAFVAEYRAKTFTTPATELSEADLDAEIMRVAEQAVKPDASEALKRRALELSKEFQKRQEQVATSREEKQTSSRRRAIALKALAATDGRGTVGNLTGDSLAQVRANLLSELTGTKVPKAKAGINALMKAFYQEFGISPDTEAGMRKNLAEAFQRAVSQEAAETPATPRSPAENLVSFTAANGQKLVGEVQSVTGNKATVAYQWNGKTKTQVVPVSQLGSPVASVATPPKYQYNQEQNTRKLGKHFPTALGVHANHDFRKSFASMAKDTALGQDYQMIAKLLSNMPEFKNMDLHLVADENIDYAGEYSWNKGKPSIAINLRLIARGQVDALGSILHEALHHVTLAKVRNPQGAFENEVVSKLDLIRESVREYAESKGFGERLDYELGSTEEFITALFTRPDFQALIASIPDSAAPAVAVGKFRSILSEIFRLIAELVHGKRVLRGSALEQAMTTSLALFNTPFRAIETGGLEALNAARSPGKGVKALFPQTGTKPINLSAAYQKAVTGKSSQWVTIKEVYEQAKADNPSLTPEAFMQFVQQQNDAGGVMISPVENVSTVEAAQPFVIGNAGVEMIVPSGTAASRIDDETDAEYLAAVEAGDMEKAQRMVDEAAKAAGYDVEGWHYSGEKFTEFDISTARTSSDIQGFFFKDTRDKDKEYGPIEYKVALKLKNPANRAALMSGFSPGSTNDAGVKQREKLIKQGYDGAIISREEGEMDYAEIIVFNPSQIKSADPVTRDADGNVIPLSQRFNPESPSILYAAPIDTTQSNEPDAGTGGGRDSASSAQNGGASERAAEVSPSGGGGDTASVLARLDAGREAAVSAAVVENDWENYTPEQKIEAVNALIRSTYGLGNYNRWDENEATVGVLLARGDGRGASVGGVVSSDGKLQITLNYDHSERIVEAVGAGVSARDLFTHAYDVAQEEIIHAADKVAAFRRWKAAGRPGSFSEFERSEAKATVTQINQTRLALQESDPDAAQKIKDAMLASWNIYHANDPVTGVAGLLLRLDRTKNDAALYLYELRRQLTQLKRQDFTTETGWQKFRSMVKKWLTDAINALRGVQDVFRSGMAGDLIQRQLADLEAALDGKPLPAAPATKLAQDVRFAELTASLPDEMTEEDIAAFKRDEPEKYAELEKMREDVLKAGGWNVGPVFHHGGFDVRENAVPDTSRGFHMGTRQAAEERAFGKPVDDFIAEADVTYDEDLGAWFWSSQGTDSYDVIDEDGFSSEEKARRSLEEFASQEDFSNSDIEDLGNLTAAYVRVSNPLVVEDQKADWDDVIKRAVSKGHDAVQYRNDFEDKGSISYIALQEGQIKSADPLTPGPKIPPSQWGDESSPLITRAAPIDIGGEAEPADGGGTQLFKKRETAIGTTYITPADITLQERRSQEETLAKARKIIAEEVQKDEKGGRAVALQRFKSDLGIPPEVRALGSGLVAQQADLLANLERDAIKQEGLDALADEAGKVSGIIGSDLEYWRNLQLAANLDVDKMAEEAARTLNILSVFRRLTPEGFLRRMKRQYNATVQESISQNFDIPPGEVEAEIMRLWRMMREAGATARGEAIAAALKAFMPRRVNTRRIIESLFPQAGTRQRMSKGGEALVRSFFQMMAGPRDQKGPLAEFDESIQNALSGMLRKVMEANGLVAKNQSNQATDIDKLVRSVSADELRFDKIAAADEAMQKELDAIEDPERRSTLRQAWEEATAKMYTNIASDATVRRAINSELKGMNVDWRKMFDSNQKPDAVKAKVVDAVMTKIEGLLTNAADPTVRQNLNMLRGEVEAAFDFIASNKRTEWLAYREGLEARRRVAEHRAAFMEALRNQGVAEDALLRISKKLLAGPLPQKPDRNPVSALVGEHMKEEVPNFVDKLVALDVDRATAEQLDTAAKALRADIAEVEKLKAAERAVKKLMDSLKPKPRAPREKIEKALKALFTAAETGALDSQEFFDALGEALGHPPLTAEQQAKIKKLTREINALPKGAARVDKQQELDEEMALWKGIAARDVLLSAWYANILSGISTQGIGLFGNLANFLPRSLFLAATNPRSARAYFQGAFGEGLKTGLKEAQAALKGRGLYKVSKYGDKNMVSALELLRKKGPATLPEWIAYIASGGTRLRYVFRIMQAIDALAWNTAREGQAYLAAHRALLDQQRAGANRSPEEFSRALIENLGGDAKQIEEDMRAARESLIALGQTPDLLTVDRMAREARNARRSSTATKLSNRFADRIVMQQDPEGIGDVISSIITVIQKKGNFMGVPFGQLLIPFNKIVANLFEQSLDYTPVGALRSYLGGHLTDIQSIDWSGKVQFKDKSVQFDAVERAERMAASVTGTLAASVMFALASLFKDEPDEDVPFMIYGFGPESKNKRDQMPKGWTPYSMKVGDAYIKFSEMPFGVMFAAAGNALDAMRYKNMDNKSSAQRLAYVLKTSAKGFTEQGVLSSFDTALEVLTFQASDKKFTDVPVNVAKGMVPGQGMLRDISVMFDPVKVKDDTIAAAFLRDFPVVRRIGTRPALNVFGEPMTFDGRIPFVRRIATVREKHPVADYLGRNGLSIPGMAQTIVVGQYLPKDMKDRIQRRALQTSAMENGVFTVEQDYNFRKRAGELTKAAVEGLLTQVPTITSDRQRENVQNLINRKVEIARRRAMLEAVPAQ